LAASSLRCSKSLRGRLSRERVLILLSLLGAARQIAMRPGDVTAVR
jgi:hypothetical protein